MQPIREIDNIEEKFYLGNQYRITGKMALKYDKTSLTLGERQCKLYCCVRRDRWGINLTGIFRGMHSHWRLGDIYIFDIEDGKGLHTIGISLATLYLSITPLPNELYPLK